LIDPKCIKKDMTTRLEQDNCYLNQQLQVACKFSNSRFHMTIQLDQDMKMLFMASGNKEYK